MFKHVPWGSNEGNESQEKHTDEGGESLTTILDNDQRGELTILIASATAAMRKSIESNFDASVSCLSNIEYSYMSDIFRLRFLPSLIMVFPTKKR